MTLSRRHFLARTAGLCATAALPNRSSSQTRSAVSALPIQHVLVGMNENRTFDHYFGNAPFAGAYGIPAEYSQPRGTNGRTVRPYAVNSPISPNPSHDWVTIHGDWDGGKVDGFYNCGGLAAMAYTSPDQLAYYYSLFENFTLCANYFCSLLGPTFPNRLYFASGTSGGITTNNITAGSLEWPCILDLLEAYKITWKVYNIGGQCSVSSGPTTYYCDNQFQFFQRWSQDPRLNTFGETDYYRDLQRGRLPQVAFLATNDITGEHPPYPLSLGESMQQQMIAALMQSAYWAQSAYLLTYDEGGGFFDHVAPPVFDAFGAGFRVPMWVISPYAKKGHLATELFEHASILKFVERVFGLPTLASMNHQFDTATPGGDNYQAANGAAQGPPAPPRDGRDDVGDLTACFQF